MIEWLDQFVDTRAKRRHLLYLIALFACIPVSYTHLDGTLLDENHQLSQRNIQAIQRLHKAGINFMVDVYKRQPLQRRRKKELNSRF